MEQYITRTYTYMSGAVSTSIDMLEAQYAPRGPRSWRTWYTCHICNFSYPAEQVVLKGGAAFCIPREHYNEMNDSRK